MAAVVGVGDGVNDPIVVLNAALQLTIVSGQYRTCGLRCDGSLSMNDTFVGEHPSICRAILIYGMAPPSVGKLSPCLRKHSTYNRRYA
jgi:hypothetical protein